MSPSDHQFITELATYHHRCSLDLEAEKRGNHVRIKHRADAGLKSSASGSSEEPHLYRNFIGRAFSGLSVTIFELGLLLCLLLLLFRLLADAQGRVPGGRLPTGTTKHTTARRLAKQASERVSSAGKGNSWAISLRNLS